MSDDLENDLDSLLLKYHSKSANYSERRMFVNFAHAHEEELKDSKVQIEIVKRIFTHLTVFLMMVEPRSRMCARSMKGISRRRGACGIIDRVLRIEEVSRKSLHDQ